MTRRSERGSLSAFVAVVAVALVMVAGMVADGGGVVAAQVKARDLAASAARAGAQALDVDAARAGAGPFLDPARAEQVASAFLAAAGTTGEVVVEADAITVTVSLRQPMRILPLGTRMVTARSTATALDEEAQP